MSGERRKTQCNVTNTRRVITLKQKLDVLNRLENGQKVVDVSKDCKLPRTTVQTIRASAEKIRESATSVISNNATRITRNRKDIMQQMENLLSMWIEHQNEHHIPLSLAIICTKAKKIFNDLKERGEYEEVSFFASRGWFDRFKRRVNLHNIKITGEIASTDYAEAQKFPHELLQIINEGGYSSKQVFNVDETGLFWKRMPQRTFISAEEKTAPGFKASKDRITILCGGNAAGDYKMKPLLIYKSETPRAFKGVCKEHLPVIWKSNKKGWMTSSIFHDWFLHYAIPEWKSYCESENLDFKILLLLDNAPSHPQFITDLCENVKVVYLPPNTTALIQPMDQGVIAAFKSYYLRTTFSQLVDETDGPHAPSIRQFWKDFNILKGVHNISAAWKEVTPACMNKVWRKIWPECVNSSGDIEEIIAHSRGEVLRLAGQVGFDNLGEEDIIELLESHENEDPDTQDLTDLAALAKTTEAEEQTHEGGLTTQHLSKAFALIEEGLNVFLEFDPDSERSSKVYRQVSDGYSCYKRIFNQDLEKRRKQKTLDKFFETHPSASCSGVETNLDPDYEEIINEILESSSD